MSNPNPLSEMLRQLRVDAGLSGAEAARRAGLSQSKISRAETGLFLPTEEDVSELCRVYNATAEICGELVRAVRDLRADQASGRVVLQRGGWWMQERIGRLEAAASRIRTFTPAIVVGLAQTRAYMRAIFAAAPMSNTARERTVDARLVRQRVLDANPAREFVFLMAEGALRWNMGGAAVMAEQLDHLVAVSQRPNVQLGVIPWTTTAPVPVVNGFTVYDSRAVLLGTHTATAIITDQRHVDDYETHWSELAASASWNDDARAVIRLLADGYRGID